MKASPTKETTLNVKVPSVLNPKQAALVGGLAGALEITASYPVEFTKVIMQLYPKFNSMGALNTFKYTVRKDGLFAPYKGYNLLLTACIPKAYMRFGIFEYLKQNIFTSPTVTNLTICGAIAGSLEGLLITTPAENLKVKLIHDRFRPNPKFRNMFHGVYKVAQEHGFKGVTAGAGITMLKECSNNAIRFPLFVGLQNVFSPYFNNNLVRDLVAGSLAGICVVLLNQPIDVVKTNLQGLNAARYNGALDCGRKILMTEGALGLYKGIRPRMVRVAMETSVTFASFNAIKSMVLKYLDAED